MPTPFESAQLILELYDLRREPTLREARAWFIREFHAETVDDALAVLATDKSGWLRMVIGYWDMAASLVQHGAIDRQMFLDANGEIVSAFSKIHHILAGWRERRGLPTFARHFEELVRSIPGSEERLEALRLQYKGYAAPRT